MGLCFSCLCTTEHRERRSARLLHEDRTDRHLLPEAEKYNQVTVNVQCILDELP